MFYELVTMFVQKKSKKLYFQQKKKSQENSL